MDTILNLYKKNEKSIKTDQKKKSSFHKITQVEKWGSRNWTLGDHLRPRSTIHCQKNASGRFPKKLSNCIWIDSPHVGDQPPAQDDDHSRADGSSQLPGYQRGDQGLLGVLLLLDGVGLRCLRLVPSFDLSEEKSGLV